MKKVFFFLLFVSQLSFSQKLGDVLKGMASGNKIEIKPEYSFVGSATYENVSTYKNKTYKTTNKWLFSAGDEMIFGTEMTNEDNKGRKTTTRGIMDYKNKGMVMLMDDSKMAMTIPFDMSKTIEEMNADPKTKYSTPTKTGKTKSILGYTCEEWVSESNDYKTFMWISTTMPISSSNFYEAMQQNLYKNGKILMPSGMKGMPLEINGTNKKTNDTFTMVCTDISKQPVMISTAGYQKL